MPQIRISTAMVKSDLVGTNTRRTVAFLAAAGMVRRVYFRSPGSRFLGVVLALIIPVLTAHEFV